MRALARFLCAEVIRGKLPPGVRSISGSFLPMRSSIFVLLPFPRKPFLPPPGGVFRRWYAGLLRAKLARSDFWTFCPQVAASWRYFSSRWYLFRTVIHLCLSIDELTQVYTFLTARPVYPKGWKSRWKTHYFHALGFVVEWKKSRTINMKL